MPGDARPIQIYVSEYLPGCSDRNESGAEVHAGTWVGYYMNNRFNGLVNPKGEHKRAFGLPGVTHWAELLGEPEYK